MPAPRARLPPIAVAYDATAAGHLDASIAARKTLLDAVRPIGSGG